MFNPQASTNTKKEFFKTYQILTQVPCKDTSFPQNLQQYEQCEPCRSVDKPALTVCYFRTLHIVLCSSTR
jgi:hypothetical protein